MTEVSACSSRLDQYRSGMSNHQNEENYRKTKAKGHVKKFGEFFHLWYRKVMDW